MLYVDKYRPKELSELHYHAGLTERLKGLSAHEDFPHILFYGPSGAGKKTRIMCLLRELFGAGSQRIKIDQRVFLNPSRRKIEVNIVTSNYHIELTPSDAGGYDRIIIQDIIKEIAQTQQVDQNAKHRFKVVVIHEADALSRDAQAALRRTMEKYMSNMRLILCAGSTSRIIAPIRSRCLLMRVGAPQEEEMTRVLQHVAKKEKFHLPTEVSSEIYRESLGNLRKAILILEALRMQSPDLSGPMEIAKPDWELYARKTADLIIRDQSPKQLLEVRGKLYELLTHAIPARLIIKTLTDRLVETTEEDLRGAIVDKASQYEIRCRQGNKAIFHLEAFVAHVMSLIKMSMEGMDWDDED